jgi:hypothetical protein
MAGITPNEGEKVIADLIYKQITTDRGTSLKLGLFTNSSVSETTTLADITQPTGTGYTAGGITLADASWTVTNDTATYAKQTFTAGAGGWTGQVRGYFIATTGTTPRLLHLEVDPSGPYTMNANEIYEITPTIVVA